MFYFLSGFTAKLAGHRDRREGAAADLLRLLRRALPAAAAVGLRAHARRQARRARLHGLARQHRAGRAGRTARASGCRSPRPARCCRRRSPASSTASEYRDRRAVRLRGAGRRSRASTSQLLDPRSTWARPGRVRRARARARADVPRQLRASSRTRPARRSPRPGRASRTLKPAQSRRRRASRPWPVRRERPGRRRPDSRTRVRSRRHSPSVDAVRRERGLGKRRLVTPQVEDPTASRRLPEAGRAWSGGDDPPPVRAETRPVHASEVTAILDRRTGPTVPQACVVHRGSTSQPANRRALIRTPPQPWRTARATGNPPLARRPRSCRSRP